MWKLTAELLASPRNALHHPANRLRCAARAIVQVDEQAFSAGQTPSPRPHALPLAPAESRGPAYHTLSAQALGPEDKEQLKRNRKPSPPHGAESEQVRCKIQSVFAGPGLPPALSAASLAHSLRSSIIFKEFHYFCKWSPRKT